MLATWVAPPLLGAAIGFLTNSLAIRMLFRPLARKRVLGIPVPLTPGIIPRRRHELARSIGRMVARELLSADAIRQRLHTEAFRGALEGQIRSVREGLLERPFGGVAAPAGPGTQAAAAGAAAGDAAGAAPAIPWLDLLRQVLKRVLERLLGSHAFIYGVRTLVARAVEDLGSRRVADLIDAGRLSALVSETLLPALGRSDLQTGMAAVLKQWLHRQWQSNTPLDAYLTAETREVLLRLFHRSLPSLLDVLFAWLRSAQVRGELELRGRAILRDVLDKLNLVQKVFVTAGQYDRTLGERMPEIVTDVIDQAEAATATAEVRAQITAGARRALTRWTARGLGELAPGAEATVDEVVDHLLDRVCGALAGTPSGQVEQAVGRWLDGHGAATVAELAARYVGLQPAAITDFLSNQLLQYLARPATGSHLAELIPDLVRDALASSAASAAAPASGAASAAAPAAGLRLTDLLVLPPETAAAIDRYFAGRIIQLLGERLPAVIETLDIEALVVAKVDALNALEVERLLRGVIARHLKWINLFGALIGALIGLMQLALRALPAA